MELVLDGSMTHCISVHVTVGSMTHCISVHVTVGSMTHCISAHVTVGSMTHCISVHVTGFISFEHWGWRSPAKTCSTGSCTVHI
jgi:hypothetical protein